jgi:kinesin family protein 4/21/27
MLEIYQEQIYDLLSKKKEKLSIRDANGRVEVPKLSTHHIATPEDAVKLMDQGQTKRCQAKTALNHESSRSHAMYSITMTKKEDGKETVSVFHIVDLAGAERAHRTKATGFQMKEANNINMSLMQLWRCLNAMKKKGESVDIIPFRESKLTHLLMPLLSRASVGGVSMIACVNPQPDDYDETITVLSNASLASKIREIAVNRSVPTAAAQVPPPIPAAAMASASSSASSTATAATAVAAAALEKKDTHKFLKKKSGTEGASQSVFLKMALQVGWGRRNGNTVPTAPATTTVALEGTKSSKRSSTCLIEDKKETGRESIASTADSDVSTVSHDPRYNELVQQIAELKRHNAELINQHMGRESEIRNEVAQEMAASTQLLLNQIEDLQTQLYEKSSIGDLTRSVKKARRRQIDISKDAAVRDLAVVEDEMEQMKIKYETEIAELKDKLRQYEMMVKDLQQQRSATKSSSPAGERRSPLGNASNSINTSPSKIANSVAANMDKGIIGGKRKSVDVVLDEDPFRKNKSPVPANNENRGPPSIFPTVDRSPKLTSNAFRTLRPAKA